MVLLGHRVFVNIQYGSKGWKELAMQATQGNYVTRVWKANSNWDWQQCVESNINLIATDKIRFYSWASFSSSAFHCLVQEEEEEQHEAGTQIPREPCNSPWATK